MNGRVHSPELKAMVVKAKLAGANAVELGEKHGINANLIYKWTRDAAGAKAKTKGAKAKTKTKTKTKGDAERIVNNLLESLRPGLVDAIRKLVDLGVERKLDTARTTVMNALKVAS